MDSFQINAVIATNKLNVRNCHCRIGRVIEKTTGRPWFDYFALAI